MQITSKVWKDGLFLEIETKDVKAPLKLKSGIRLHKIFTVDLKLIEKKISEMNADSFKKVLADINAKVF